MKNPLAFSLALAGCLVLAAAGCSDDDGDDGAAGAAGAAGMSSGSAALCTSSGKNAYDTYGAAFGTVNEAIFTKVFAEVTANGDKNLGSSFQNSNQVKNDLPGFKANLADFLIAAYGGPKNYKGRDMVTAHTGLAITSAQYDYFVSDIIVPALTENGVPVADVGSCFAPAVTDAAFKASIVGK